MAIIKGTTGRNTIHGSDRDDLIYVYEGNDILYGDRGNDLLGGGLGADTMYGERDNDTYIVDNVGDLVREQGDEGIDTVKASVTYVLAANVEKELTGTVAINGRGNALNNRLTGNSADNILNGGMGVDTLSGGRGNDTYILDNPFDLVVENLGEGIDTVQTAFNYTLGANIENLVLTGMAGVAGNGNYMDNALTGNAANNTLHGGAGADTLAGGRGDDALFGELGSDTYLFSIGGGHDQIMETAGNGIDVDTVKLGPGIDPGQVSLVKLGPDLLVRLNATGDELRIAGQFIGSGIEKIVFADGSTWGRDVINNPVNNVVGTNIGETLFGTAGADVFQGHGADDVLIGDLGSDTYLFAAGDGRDSVLEANSANGDIDTIKLAPGIDPSQVSLVQLGPDLLVRLTATGDEVRVAGQFAGYGVEQIQFANGTTWGANEINDAAWEMVGTAMDDTLSGHSGTDIMQGLAGNDALIGRAGSDTYLFGAGDGHDVVMEFRRNR